MKKYIIALAVALISVTTSLYGQSYKVIVNNSNSVTTLSKAEVSSIFLKRQNKWSDNSKIVPVDLESKSSVRASFSKDLLRKSVAQVRAYWQQKVFAGKATPPLEFNTDAEVVNYIKNNPKAIGYVSSETNVSGVKVITVN